MTPVPPPDPPDPPASLPELPASLPEPPASLPVPPASPPGRAASVDPPASAGVAASARCASGRVTLFASTGVAASAAPPPVSGNGGMPGDGALHAASTSTTASAHEERNRGEGIVGAARAP